MSRRSGKPSHAVSWWSSEIPRREVIPSVATTSSFFSAADPFSSPPSTAARHEVTFKWPQLAIQAALHLATGWGLFPFITATRAQNEDSQVAQAAEERFNARWEDVEEVRSLMRLLALLSAAVTSWRAIKRNVGGWQTTLHRSSTYCLRGLTCSSASIL